MGTRGRERRRTWSTSKRTTVVREVGAVVGAVVGPRDSPRHVTCSEAVALLSSSMPSTGPLPVPKHVASEPVRSAAALVLQLESVKFWNDVWLTPPVFEHEYLWLPPVSVSTLLMSV